MRAWSKACDLGVSTPLTVVDFSRVVRLAPSVAKQGGSKVPRATGIGPCAEPSPVYMRDEDWASGSAALHERGVVLSTPLA